MATWRSPQVADRSIQLPASLAAPGRPVLAASHQTEVGPAGRPEGGLPGARMEDRREDEADPSGDAAGAIEVGGGARFHGPEGEKR
jgi:hypothetical protein